MTNRLFVTLGLAAVLLLAAAGCDLLGGEEEGGQQPELAIMPLAEGNYWAFQVTYAGLTDSMVQRVTGQTTVRHRGKTHDAFTWNYFADEDSLTAPYDWLAVSERGSYYNFGGVAGTDTLVKRSLQHKYPARAGDTWNAYNFAFSRYERTFYVSDTLEYTLTATDEEIETPAGTFRCYVYHYSYRPAKDVTEVWHVYHYFAPGIGPVAQIIKGIIPGYDEEQPDIKQTALLYDYRVRGEGALRPDTNQTRLSLEKEKQRSVYRHHAGHEKKAPHGLPESMTPARDVAFREESQRSLPYPQLIKTTDTEEHL